MRAFIAVDLSEHIRNEISRVEGPLGGFSSQVKWVKPDSIHLTLKFLGEISEAQQQSITSTLSAHPMPVPGFDMQVRGIGFFPNARAPRVVWMGVVEGGPQLQAMAAELERRLEPLGFPPEARLFSAHITIGRVKFLRDVPAFLKATSRFSEYDCGNARVESFHLYESQLRREGAIYTKRATFGLE
ncbi:MAG: RNA 2',3'-cyclic phosphodiesterase [Acidobacteriia bacterium]|nr:RNA 2',3'-cyclic phosphodiesterase [Terriglobia bacterium]